MVEISLDGNMIECDSLYDYNIYVIHSLFFLAFYCTFYKLRLNSLSKLTILLFSIYLITQTVFDFYETFKNKNINLSRIISHLGFGLLIFSISLNQIFSVEKSFNARLGDEKNFQNFTIKFNNLETFSKNNFKSVKGYF